ncbi:hypothetical protein [Myroides odoratimimus]|uniref:hypothetical protein n=1 Tax=Myroides odoratimimus TaxID=76832 RepID=UPI001CE07809|nr:hypothetical protein [Myroides odoratimimus]MCA4807257.1 hypothetical protein [Myroides odoratimimus]MDM1093588.1 hypothetical protein [Myroides odoratimimus]MDM1400997.1 hypothetical protein [Myroides odoratimimus]MDM1411222.1 hypothetical protein [Myroides odoratimimus]MDM1464214.1 hypothetical protein [Myroides odoratimimus]
MKKLILSATVAFTVLTTSNIYAQQGFGTNTPDRSSAVDIFSNKRGLLIPRLELKDTKIASPVSKPANALFVYNTATAEDVTPGFYYWETTDQNDETKGKWVRFVSSNSGSAVTVTEGANVTVEKTIKGHDTEYKVSVKGGDKDGQVLVTEDTGKKDSEGNPIYISKWVNPQDFINGTIVGVNGVTAEKVGDKVNVGLGGDLSKATEIKTTPGDKTLAISGLETLVGKDATTGNKFDATTQNIVVMGSDGILKNVSAKDLVEDAIDKGAINGKALTSKGNSIQIDGTAAATALLKDVNIEVKGGDKDGQILVTTPKLDDKGQPIVENGKTVYETKWVDAAGNTVKSGQGITVKDDNTVNLGGKIKNDGTTPGAIIDLTDNNGDKAGDIAIKGLEELVGKDATTGNKLDSGSDKLVIADKDGVLKQTSAKNLIEDAIEKGTDGTDPLKAKTLKGDGITITATGAADTTLEVANSLLKDVTLGIADNAITTNKINNGAVTQDKLYAGTKDADGNGTPAEVGTVPVANADGTVTYKNIATALGADLTTDGKIVIGDNKSTLDKLDNAVLVATQLSIKEGSITSTDILDGTIANVDLGNGAVSADKMTSNTTANGTATPAGVGQIPVADGNGGVTYKEISGGTLKGKALKSESIVVTGGAKALLDETSIEIKGGTTAGQVLVTKEVKDGEGKVTYVTEWVDAAGNTVKSGQGITVKSDNTVNLGGKVEEPTILDLTGNGSLAITGLNAPTDKNTVLENVKIGTDGKLYAVSKSESTGSITINEGGDINIGGDTNYSINQEEVVIEVTLGATDTNLMLPAVNGTEGQTISIKIVNITEDHVGYLNIKSTEGGLAYGAMPFQGWIIKSNGTKWIVVGRN